MENFSSEPLGDELDGSVNKEVATERYKRNHVFIDLIFSPFSTGKFSKYKILDAIKSSSSVDSKNVEDLKKDIVRFSA